MARFLIDEDLGRSLARTLRDNGLEADDVRDIGLRGSSDSEIFIWAAQRAAVLVTGDLGFANLLAFPLGSHAGIVVVRFPNEVPTSEVNRSVVAVLRDLPASDLVGGLTIIEPTRVRRKRSP